MYDKYIKANNGQCFDPMTHGVQLRVMKISLLGGVKKVIMINTTNTSPILFPMLQESSSLLAQL